MIRKMPGIENASVIYDIKDKGGLSKEKLYSASVAVKTLNSVPLDENRVTSIRNLVAASFAGMAPESVAVTDLTHNRTYPAGRAGEVLSGTQDPAYQPRSPTNKSGHAKSKHLGLYARVIGHGQCHPQ